MELKNEIRHEKTMLELHDESKQDVNISRNQFIDNNKFQSNDLLQEMKEEI